MIETTDIRTAGYTTCRACGKTVAPQMMRAIFAGDNEDNPRWRVVAWECLKCKAPCITCKHTSGVGCENPVCFNKESPRYRESIGTRRGCPLHEQRTYVTLPYIGD